MAGCRYLKEEEYEAVKLELSEKLRDKCMFVLGTKSGFRITELLSLYVKDVIVNDHVADRVKVSRRNTKGKIVSRSVVLTDEAKASIVEYVNTMDSWTQDTPLFKSREGYNKPISRTHAWAILKNAANNADVTGDVATHSMRKTYAQTVLKLSGNNPLVVQAALGHANLATTIKYLAVHQQEVDDVMKKMK